MNVSGRPPSTVEQFLRRIEQEYSELGGRLRLIARFVEAHPDDFALENVQSLSAQCGVHPSAVVRFAKHFGFTGFSDMRRLFRECLVARCGSRRSDSPHGGTEDTSPACSLKLEQFDCKVLDASIAGMKQLQRTLDRAAFGRALAMMAGADTLWIVGLRHAFPVAAYLEQALQDADRRVVLFSGLGGTQLGQTRSAREGDVVIVILLSPYAEETVQVAQRVRERGARLITVCDSRMNPLAVHSDALLVAQTVATSDVYPVAAMMALAQSLIVALRSRRSSAT